jgi:hypothetical protein
MPEKSHFFTVAYKRSKSPMTAISALRFIVEYGQTAEELGSEITIDDYAAHIGQSRSQAFRRQAAFRTCFPKDDVLALWEIVKPALRKSSFKNSTPTEQAVFIGSMICELS